MSTKTETDFSRNYQTGIQALNAGQFEDAVTYLTAAQVTATSEDNDTEENLLAGFLATAQFGLTLPPEVATDFDQLIALGQQHLGAAEITEANHCFSIANDLVQESDPANLSQMFVACERLAQVAYLQGDEDGARGLLSTIIYDGSPDVLPATLEAAKALLAKLDGDEETAPDGEAAQDDDEE